MKTIVALLTLLVLAFVFTGCQSPKTMEEAMGKAVGKKGMVMIGGYVNVFMPGSDATAMQGSTDGMVHDDSNPRTKGSMAAINNASALVETPGAAPGAAGMTKVYLGADMIKAGNSTSSSREQDAALAATRMERIAKSTIGTESDLAQREGRSTSGGATGGVTDNDQVSPAFTVPVGIAPGGVAAPSATTTSTPGDSSTATGAAADSSGTNGADKVTGTPATSN